MSINIENNMQPHPFESLPMSIAFDGLTDTVYALFELDILYFIFQKYCSTLSKFCNHWWENSVNYCFSNNTAQIIIVLGLPKMFLGKFSHNVKQLHKLCNNGWTYNRIITEIYDKKNVNCDTLFFRFQTWRLLLELLLLHDRWRFLVWIQVKPYVV